MSNERTILWHPPPRFQIIIILFSLIFIYTVLADTPSDNDIPTLAMRILGSGLFTEDITMELLCELSWLNFDAVNFAGRATNDYFQDLMLLCDSTGIYYSICPAEVMQYLKEWADPTYRYWFRNSDESLISAQCFARCNADYDSIEQYTTAESLYYEDPVYSIYATIVNELAESTEGHDYLWFYEVYDEAPSQQWRHAVENEDPWDDYIPNVYTQDTLKCGTLSLEEVEASGIFSWQKFLAEHNETNEVPFTLNFALLHTIEQDDYTGLRGDIAYGTMTDQATSVRGMMEAEYQGPPDGLVIPLPVNNHPEFISFDYYAFRQVHPDSALAHSGPAKMCDNDWLFLIEHFEEAIDSTVIPAWEDSVPVYFYPQTFGLAGGPAMYDTSGTLGYNSYRYRKPASQEFRMLCNLALLHQAKGIFPYNLTSYIAEPGDLSLSGNFIVSSLLDRHNIPFDADYEEWVYTGRWPVDEEHDYEYIRPDSIPPWVDGYDTLYEVEDPPILPGGDPKNNEIWYEWLFGPYAELYNDIGGILADVKWIGPEMHDLWWCSGNYSDGAEISYNSNPTPIDLITPVIKVFEDEAQESCYLFYVDRYCITNSTPYEITFSPPDLPGHADCSTRLLDHSRRFIMEGTYDEKDNVYTFLDTLDAGEGRLVELIDSFERLPADVRITSSDVRMILDGNTLVQMETTVGDSVDIIADFYNMGTASISNVIVTLYDSTAGQQIGSDTLDFDGLAWSPPCSCRTCDRSTASFSWAPDSTDIGVHRLSVTAATWPGEPDSDDNSIDFVFLVNPRDYATEVRGDSWDMDDSTSSNAWNTDDIEAVAINWDTTSTGWTDSVSGMFEGIINYDPSTNLFKGDISFAIPEDSIEYIDTDKYHMLSFGITVNNPNRLDDNACGIRIRWKDTQDEWHGWQGLLSGSGYHVSNGWDGWTVIGPIDLKADTSLHWGDDDASELWFRIQGSGSVVKPPKPVDIRIGWVRLEESAQ